MKEYTQLNAEELKRKVCEILDNLNLSYKTEVNSKIGSSIIGKGRRVDVVVYDKKGGVFMHIECKSQNVSGTTEDKLFKAVAEAARDKTLGIPSVIVFSGFGWNAADARHALLNGSVRIEFFKEWMTFYARYDKNNPVELFDDNQKSSNNLFE